MMPVMPCRPVKSPAQPVAPAETAADAHIMVGFGAKVAAMRDKITEWIEEEQRPGNGGIITVALFEIAIERQLRFSDEDDARALIESAINKVVRRKRGTGTVQ